MGNPDPAPDRVGPSQPPLNVANGNGYIMLRGLMEARDCEVGWNKVMKAWGTGDEKVVAKNLQLLFNARRSEDQARDTNLPRRWQSKSSLGSGVGGPLLKKFHSPLTSSVPHDRLGTSTQRRRAASSWRVWGVGPSSHTPMSSPPPEVLPPDSRDISGCHLSSFLPVRGLPGGGASGDGPGGGALGHQSAAEGGHAADGGHQPPPWVARPPRLQGWAARACFNLWTPDPRHRHHQPNTRHLNPPPP